MENSGNLVRIRVKSASHRCEDIEISCPLDSAVRNVKEIIKDQYPLHPEIKEQRIIYAGHLLEDDQILREIFAHGGQVSVSGGYTFHLACNSTFLRKTTTANETTEEQDKPKEEQRNNEGCNVHGRLPSPQSVPSGIPQDMLALHQLYVEQMMNFMSQWNQGTIAPVWLPAPTPPMMHGMHSPWELAQNLRQPPVHHQVFNQNHPNLEQQQQPVQVQPPPAPRINEEDEPQRDLLDWIYTGSRLCLILSVVYFYSNFTRFLLVLLFTALVMLAQRRPGFMNAFRAEQQQAPAEPQPQRNEINNPEEAAGEVQDAPNPEGEGNTEGSPPSPPEELIIPAQAQQQQRFLDVARTFVMTFVTSLIPEMNP